MDISNKDRLFDVMAEKVLILECLGPPESDWNQQSFQVISFCLHHNFVHFLIICCIGCKGHQLWLCWWTQAKGGRQPIHKGSHSIQRYNSFETTFRGHSKFTS